MYDFQYLNSSNPPAPTNNPLKPKTDQTDDSNRKNWVGFSHPRLADGS